MPTKTIARILFAATFLALALPSHARTVVYPVEAMADFWQLGSEEFNEKHGGIDFTGLGIGDDGWYVRYRHENLNLFFGPVEERDEARRHMWELEAIRDAAVRNRAALATSQIDIVRFSYSDVRVKRGQGGEGGGDTGGSGEGSADEDRDGNGIADSLEGKGAGGGDGNDPNGTGQRGLEIAGLSGQGGQGGQNPGGQGQTGNQPGGTQGNRGGSQGSQGTGQQGGQQGGGQQGNQSGQQGSQSGQQSGQQGGSGSGSGQPSDGQPGSGQPSSSSDSGIFGFLRRLLGLG